MLHLTQISVVVPVYNSQATLSELCTRLLQVLRPLTSDVEIVLVNDGSADTSWDAIQALTREHEPIVGINLMRNYGQHNALLAGIRAARHDVIVTIDDDLQHPPEEIPKLLATLQQGYDVVYGTSSSYQHSPVRNALSALAKRGLARAMGIKNIRDLSAFRAFRTELRAGFASYESPYLLLDALLSWSTTRFATVEVLHAPRRSGKSNYDLFKLINQLILMITGFSTAPLRLVSIVGFAFTLLGVALVVYAVLVAVLVGTLPGFAFLASIISIFAGAQLFALGLIGEYLARIFQRSLQKPTYVIRSTSSTK